jgi:MFS family permease
VNRTRFSVRWFLIFWVFVVGAIAYLDRVNISIAGGDIAREFHLSNVQLGWVFSAFIAGYALFQAPAGWLADRYGARVVLTLGVVWWSGSGISRVKLHCGGVDSIEGAWFREWIDFFGRGLRSGSCAAAGDLFFAALRMANVVLGEFPARPGRGARVVHLGARFAFAASADFKRRTGADRRRYAAI